MKEVFQHFLFQGIAKKDQQATSAYLKTQLLKYQKGEHLLLAGQKLTSFGILQNGQAFIQKEDFAGRNNLVAELRAGDIFAEAFVCARLTTCPVTVTAREACEVWWLDISKLLQNSSALPSFLIPFYINLLEILAKKNLQLTNKIRYLSFKSIRQKLLNYLFEQYLIHNSKNFSLPFKRQDLADYLGVERSALSRELGRLKQEDLLSFQKNTFFLKEKFFQQLIK